MKTSNSVLSGITESLLAAEWEINEDDWLFLKDYQSWVVYSDVLKSQIIVESRSSC